jgi:hypothetical protein
MFKAYFIAVYAIYAGYAAFATCEEEQGKRNN